MLVNDLMDFSARIKKINTSLSSEINAIKEKYSEIITKKFGELKKLEDKISEIEKQIESTRGQVKERVLFELQKDFYDKNGALLSYFDISPVSAPATQSIKELKAVLKELFGRLNELKDKMNNDFAIAEKEKRLLESEQNAEIQALTQKCEDKKKNYKDTISARYEQAKEMCIVDYNNASQPQKATQIPEYLPVGNCILPTNDELAEITDDQELKIPYEIDARNSGNIVLKIDTSGFDTFDSFLENTILGLTMNYIESFPSGSIKVGICSSYFSSMQKLNALYSSIVKGGFSITGEACTNQQRFNSMLNTVENRSNLISAKLLENNCFDLNSLYEKGIKTEPYQLVVVHDMLQSLTEENLRAFYGCIKGLHHCGVRFIIIDDFSEEIYKNKSAAYRNVLSQILSTCQTFELKDNLFADKNGYVVELRKISDAMQMQHVYDFGVKYCENSKENELPYISYEKIGFGTSDADKNDYESIVIPVAINEPNVWKIEFSCVANSSSATPIANLVIGVPGTGKSTLIDSMIMNGAMKYSPDEVVFQLLDFKDGVSSSVYTMEECKIPHIKVVSEGNKPEEAEIMLSNILAESERRNKEFKTLGKEIGSAVRNIAEYNKEVARNSRGRKNMPRLIIVIDECQYLFEDESLAKKCEDIVRKCRSQGIHLVLATQKLGHKMNKTVQFVDGRYCFEITKEDAEQLLSRKYASTIASEVPKGSYMAYASNNSGQDCERIRIAWDGGKTNEYAKRIRDKWSTYPINIVTIGDNSPLVISKDRFDSMMGTDEFIVPIGENYVDHSIVFAHCENSRPLIVVGTNQNAPDNILSSVILSAVKRKMETFVVDASRNQRLSAICNRDESSFVHCGDEQQYLDILQKIHDIYEERKSNIRADHHPVLFAINSVQNIIDLLNNTRKSDSTVTANSNNISMGGSFADFAKQLTQNNNSIQSNIYGKETLFNLISNSYKVNIFICLSLDTITLTNDAGEAVFGYQQRNILKMSDYKILVSNINADVKNIMEDAFKEKMMADFSESMAFMSIKQQDFCKFRYFNHFDI
ncbi:MAG: hypothetical protein IJV87_02485 [Clostridia bacterium]|nr:hypothetical protein [Clostridia bacterium]